MASDMHGPLPLTLADLQRRLELGQIYRLDSANYPYSLSMRGDRFYLKQGSLEHSFKSLQVAVLTLLNCSGTFEPEPE